MSWLMRRLSVVTSYQGNDILMRLGNRAAAFAIRMGGLLVPKTPPSTVMLRHEALASFSGVFSEKRL